jgi:predicted kinase
MVLAAYKDMFYNSRNEEQRLLTQIAILFHDVGKPLSEVKKFNEVRGNYNSYGGHELKSACWFIDYACQVDLGLNVNQLRAVRWMIENHLPYEKGKDKMVDWQADMTFVLGKYVQCFRDLMLSDAKGRITDDNKFEKSLEWANNYLVFTEPRFQKLIYSAYYDGLKTAYVLVGPSGSGKSTFTKGLDQTYTRTFNKDDLRVEFYKTSCGKEVDYATAWEWCARNNGIFNQFITRKFNELLEQGWDIVLDNTNLSPKARRQWIIALRAKGYHIVGVEFWSSMKLLKERRESRDDRDIPMGSLYQQYNSQGLLRYGSEVHEVRMVKN